LLSREQREKIKGYKTNNIPYIVPNYSFVKERTVVMAIYKKVKNIKKFKKKEFIGLDSSINFNPDNGVSGTSNNSSGVLGTRTSLKFINITPLSLYY
jgi:hypothetical protein